MPATKPEQKAGQKKKKKKEEMLIKFSQTDKSALNSVSKFGVSAKEKKWGVRKTCVPS